MSTIVKHRAHMMSFDTLVAGLRQAWEQGLVRRTNKDGASLFCYTKTCVYDRKWNEFTTLARGLILDLEAKRILASPLEKFFNLSEITESIPSQPFETFEKVDGSMITVYWHRDRWCCATKGSLDSPQAQWAERELYKRDLSDLIPGTTYVFEAVYADNRIVVRYPKDELVLLSAYAPDGVEATYDECKLVADHHGWRMAERFQYESLADLVSKAATLPATEEGFVLRFANGLRLKIKGFEYCRLHRMISGCTPLALWEAMMSGADLHQMRRDLPEEFWPDFDRIVAVLGVRLATLMHQIDTAAASVAHLSDRDLGISLKDRVPSPWREFVFHRRKRGTVLPPVNTTPNQSKNHDPIPLIRRSVFMHIRPTGNRLEGYIPSATMNRVQAEAL